MRTLAQHLNEKLIINRNYKNVDDIELLFDNVKFKPSVHYNVHALSTNDDIFSIMADYIRDHNVRSFSDFDSYKKIAREDDGVCLTVFNKRIKEIDIFQKMSDYVYNNLVIFKRTSLDLYQFKKYGASLPLMHVLKNSNTWANTNDVEYYEISEETFECISKLYDELFKKCEH